MSEQHREGQRIRAKEAGEIPSPARWDRTRSAAEVVPRAVGEFFGTTLDTLRTLPRRPFHFREFVQQAWFIASVSIVPTLLMDGSRIRVGMTKVDGQWLISDITPV